MSTKRKTVETLLLENEELRVRLEEAEETLRALRSGEVDALMVGEQLFILESAGSASSRFHGDVLAQINEAVFATDGERRLVYINEAAERQYRVKADEVLGKHFETMFSVRWPEEAGREKALAELRETGRWRGENIHIRQDGSEFFAESTASVRSDRSAEIPSILTVVRDITDRKLAHAELKRRDERYRAFIEQSSEGIWRFEITPPVDVTLPVEEQIALAFANGSLAECNEAMAKQYRCSAEEMIGATIGDLLLVDDPNNYQLIKSFIESGYNLSEAESHERAADGSERYFLNNLVGYVEDGSLERVWGTKRDITASKQTEKDQARLASIVESSDDAIVSKDTNGIITSWNTGAEKIFGYSADEAIGKSIRMLVPDDIQDEEDDILSRIRRGEGVDHYETRRRRKDGEEIIVSLTVSPIRDKNNLIIGASKIARDITANKLVEQDLRESQVLLSMAMKSSRMGAWEMELESDIVRWTSDLEQIFGLEPGVFGGTEAAFFALIHEEDREATWYAIQESLREHKDYSVEFRFHHTDGTIRWMEGRGEAVYSEDGEPIRLYGIGTEITERRAAEEALRESEARFSKAFNSSPLAVTITSLQTGRLLEVNESFTRITGYSREEAIGSTTAELNLWSAPGDRDNKLAMIAKEGRVRDVEYRFRTKDGGEMIGLLSAELLELGGEQCSLTVIQDITQRKALEEKLTAQNEILRAVTAGASLSEILDKTTIIVGNKIRGSLTSILLASEDETTLIEGSAKSLPPEYNAAIDGLQVGESVGSCGTAAYRRMPVIVEDIAKSPLWDGYADLAKSHGLRACWSNPIISSTGQLLGTFATYFEEPRTPTADELSLIESAARAAGLAIERKRSEETLLALERRSAEEYQSLLSRIVPLAEALGTARDLLTVYRALKDFVYSSMPCSAFFVSFFDPETNMRTAAFACSDEGDVDISLLPPIELSRGGGPNSKAVFERRSVVTNSYMEEMRDRPHMVAQDNGIEPRTSLAVPMTVMDRVIGTLEVQSYLDQAFRSDHVIALEMVANLAAVSIENIRLIETEANARQEAEAANRMKDEFLSVLSHELRTPLNAMLGWVRMLRAGVLDEERSAKALEVIERNTRQQGSLIEDLLDVSRIISGRMRVEKELIDLKNVIQAAAETVRPLAIAKNLDLDVAETGPLMMKGDPVRLQQVITNLLQNAVKFTAPDGGVRLWTEVNGAIAKIVVSDDGVGIEEEFLPHIFDRFSQADASTKRTFNGLGLGLTIVRTIVDLHGGTINAESPGRDLGATFTIELPLDTAGAPLAATNGTSATGSNVDGLSILLVDDDVENLLPLRIFLEHERAKVVCAGSAEEALEELANQDFHVVISDIAMPANDGYELIAQLRKKNAGRNSNVPAIALTAYASETDRMRALASGYQSHLAKPVDFDQLLTAIGNIRRT
jgi:PAS domain S-box-containing protein